MTASDDARIGKRIGPFQILALLGQGGMGVVYRALDTRLEREVALKLVSEAASAEPDRHRRILREAKVAASVSHPSIATIYEVGETEDGAIYIAMELITGRSLRELLEQGPMPVDRAIEIGAQIARALGAAHAQSVVHRDVKPENVIVTPAGDVKVLDFGIAKALAGRLAPSDKWKALRTTPGNVLGTPEYMSPEYAAGSAVDQRSDVFSLGVLLYEMFAGRRPFRGTTSVAVLLDVMLEDPAPIRALRADVPPHVAAVIERCLEKAPSRRFASGTEVAAALVLEGRRSTPSADDERADLPALPSAEGARTRRPSARRSLASVAVAAVALSVAGSSFVWSRREPSSRHASEHEAMLPERKLPAASSDRADAPPAFETGPLVETEVLVPDAGESVVFALDFRASRLAYADIGGALRVLDLATRNDRAVPLPANQHATSVEFVPGTSDRLIVALTGAQGDRAVELSLGDGSIRNLASRAARGSLSPDGRYLATSDSSDLRIRDVEADRQAALFSRATNAAWGPSGAHLYYLHAGAAGTHEIVHVTAPVLDGEVLFASFRLGQISGMSALARLQEGLLTALHDPPPLPPGTSLWLVPYDGSPARPLARVAGVSIDRVATTLDGRFVAAAMYTTTRRVRVAPLRGNDLGEWAPVAGEGRTQRSPSWAGDDRLLYSTDRRGRFEIAEAALGATPRGGEAGASGNGEARLVASSDHALVAPVPDGRGGFVVWEVRTPDSSGRVEASLVRFDQAGDRTMLRNESALFSARNIWPVSIAVECGGTTCIVARELAGGGLSLEGLEGATMTELSDTGARASFAVDARGSEAVFASDDAIVRVDLASFAIRRQPIEEGAICQSVTYVGSSRDILVSVGSDRPPSLRIYRLTESGERHMLYESEQMCVGELTSSPDGTRLAASTESIRGSIARVFVPEPRSSP